MGAQLDGEYALHTSRRRLRAWPGECGGRRSAGLGVCFLRLPPPTSDLARRRERRAARLDGEFASYASRRLRARPGRGGGGELSWTGSWLSTPLAADFGPGPPAEAAAGRGVCFLRLPPKTSGLARRRRRQGAQLDGGISSTPRADDFGPGQEVVVDGRAAGRGAFYASRRRLRVSPGEGGGGARCLGQEFAFLSSTHRPLDTRPSYARSPVPTPS